MWVAGRTGHAASVAGLVTATLAFAHGKINQAQEIRVMATTYDTAPGVAPRPPAASVAERPPIQLAVDALRDSLPELRQTHPKVADRIDWLISEAKQSPGSVNGDLWFRTRVAYVVQDVATLTGQDVLRPRLGEIDPHWRERAALREEMAWRSVDSPGLAEKGLERLLRDTRHLNAHGMPLAQEIRVLARKVATGEAKASSPEYTQAVAGLRERLDAARENRAHPEMAPPVPAAGQPRTTSPDEAPLKPTPSLTAGAAASSQAPPQVAVSAGASPASQQPHE
ncbi:MAG: hypothetical protein JO122_09960, partial [Acetobacteraceae bacterium]|nr:hypothetical protein [Acetobacteraceae bacterium]